MKLKINSLLLIAFLIGITSYSQEVKPQKENKFRSLKVGYITETLELTANEAEIFWPIYNLHQDRIYQLRHGENRKLRGKIKKSSDIEALSDAEAENILNALLKLDDDIKKEQALMMNKLKKVLTPKKLLKLHKAEHDFNRKILEQYRKRREQNNDNKKEKQ